MAMASPGHRTATCALVILTLAISACGDSSDGGSRELIVEPLSEQYLLSEPVRWNRGSITLTSAEADDFLLARTEVPDNQSVTVSRFHADLTPVGLASVVPNGSSHSLSGPSLCAVDGRTGLSWGDTIPPEQMPLGINLDLGNVRAASFADGSSPPQSFEVNANTIGSQGRTRVACLSDGHLAILWVSTCQGVRKVSHNSYVSYEPPECATEPVDGLYLQVFSESGDPDRPMQLVLAREQNEYGFGAGAIAALPDDRILVVTGPVVRVYDRNGRILDEGTLPNPVNDPMLSCANSRCVAVMPQWAAVIAVIIDPDNLANAFEVEIKASVVESDEPDRRVDVVPYEGSVSCDSSGICLVTWRLVREIYYSDTGESEELGMYAVALDSRSGKFGSEAELLDAASVAFNDTGPISVAVGDGEFVTARVTTGTVLLGRVNVR